MILRPQNLDLRIISHFLGKITLGFGMMMVFPIAVALIFGELAPVVDFAIGLVFAMIVGYLLIDLARLPEGTDMYWTHGMVVAATSWLVGMALGAVPLYLSGHWASFLDACFETMSGLATTGLTLVQDLDHLSHAANFWRHFMMFLGGQGIVVVALCFLVKSGAGAFRLYVGEARDEKILPNVVETAKFIWKVSLVYFILGTLALAVAGVWAAGLSVKESIFHAACIFMAGFDTGGFAPQSQNVMYYQSVTYEIITVVIMIWGSINFNLHYAVWTGRRGELRKDIEIRTFLSTLTVVTFLAALGLARVYPEWLVVMRRGFYQVISAHTGTGFQNIYAPQFVTEWGPLSLYGLIIAMGLGVSACSTTGGVKMLRIGLIFKAFREDIKRLLSSESTVVVTKFRHLRDVFLDDKMVRSAAIITIAYMLLYLLGAVVASAFGVSFVQAFFESTSAAGNVGLSCGVTQTAMPVALKAVFIVQMWMGRLEFISVFVLIGFIVSYIRGK